MASTPRPIIIGSGIAGLWTAWRLAAEGRPSLVLTKGKLADSASAWAQGGIAVALGPGDSPSQHAADTLAAGDGMNDPEAVKVLTNEGPDRIRELLAMGAVFDRGPDGALRLGLEAAHTRPRIIHAGGDQTGAALVAFLTEKVRRHPLIEILRYTEVAALSHDGYRVTGVLAIRGRDAVELAAPHVVLATGGVGQLYAVTTNPLVATGDGWALAWRAGAELRDIEFLQFHPTALKLPGVNPGPADHRGGARRRWHPGGPRRPPLRVRCRSAGRTGPAGCRGPRGGHRGCDRRCLAGCTGNRRLHRPLPRRDPDPRPTTAWIPRRDLIPVAPALHYAMGGVRTDLDGRTVRQGLWAVGEVASTGVHGANRLASNSLLEGLVFADRVARALVASGTGDWAEPGRAGRKAPPSGRCRPGAASRSPHAGARPHRSSTRCPPFPRPPEATPAAAPPMTPPRVC